MEASNKLLIGTKLEDRTELKILHLTDLHTDKYGLENLIMLKDKIRENKIIYDLVLISGDMQSYMIKDWEDPIKCAKAEEEIISILGYAESICPHVYFIPGNHDPPNLFLNPLIKTPSLMSEKSDIGDDMVQLKENWYNMHGNIVTIAKGLKLAGYGGSKDNYIEKDGEILGTFWEAFPYSDEEDFSIGLKSMFAKLTHEYATEDPFQLILMTHIGPYSSMSAVDTLARANLGENIYSGSKTLENLIDANSKFILWNVHGHNHASEKQTEKSGVPIINPNAFFFGKYAEYKLKINDKSKWEIDEINFLEV